MGDFDSGRFGRLIEMFDLKINRIALNKTTILENLTDSEEKELKDKITPPENYNQEENLIEYASHRVSRKKVECLGEQINIGRNVTGLSSIKDNKVVINQVRIDTDINTLGEQIKERFNVQNCREFFQVATESNQDVLNNIMGVFDAS